VVKAVPVQLIGAGAGVATGGGVAEVAGARVTAPGAVLVAAGGVDGAGVEVTLAEDDVAEGTEAEELSNPLVAIASAAPTTVAIPRRR
jgi:hypothetical protein